MLYPGVTLPKKKRKENIPVGTVGKEDNDCTDGAVLENADSANFPFERCLLFWVPQHCSTTHPKPHPPPRPRGGGGNFLFIELRGFLSQK